MSPMGFGQYANSPAPFMEFSPHGYRPYSPEDPIGFGRFPTPQENQNRAHFATQGLESMNLSSSFESVSNMPASMPSKGKGEEKSEGEPEGEGEASEAASCDGRRTEGTRKIFSRGDDNTGEMLGGSVSRPVNKE